MEEVSAKISEKPIGKAPVGMANPALSDRDKCRIQIACTLIQVRGYNPRHLERLAADVAEIYTTLVVG